GFGAVFKVAQVVQGDFIAINVGPGGARDVGLPRLVSSWFDGQPPRQDDGKSNRDKTCRAPEAFEKKWRGEHCQEVDEGERRAEPRDRQIEVKRARCPERCYSQHEVDRQAKQATPEPGHFRGPGASLSWTVSPRASSSCRSRGETMPDKAMRRLLPLSLVNSSTSREKLSAISV